MQSTSEGDGNPLQYSCLENPMDWGVWSAAVHGVARGRTRLSDFTFPFHFHALEKEVAAHSSVLAWRIPGMGEPGGLPSTGSHRVEHDWSDLAAAADCSTPGSSVFHCLLEFAQIHSIESVMRSNHLILYLQNLRKCYFLSNYQAYDFQYFFFCLTSYSEF